jgi:Ca2+-binding RTX toxin-like protein
MRKLCATVALLPVAAALIGPAPATATDLPSCAEGPVVEGQTMLGTECDDTLRVPPGVSSVDAGPGEDTIVPGPIRAASSCPEECRLGLGSQTFEGGPGDDVVFGERGNDTLLGGEGNDRLYGGIGDDQLRGGPGDDLLSGGHGFDSLDGEEGSDYVRGDGTIDRIFDTGSTGEDTLSYSTGVTPGFTGPIAVPGFPSGAEGRGVRLELGAGGMNGNDGTAPFGGGVDEVEGGAFEKVIGTPFSDYIVGSEAGETIWGGGGADVVLGQGGNDTLFGGAEGDDLDGGAGTNTIDGGPGEDHCQSATSTNCEAVPAAVVPRDSSRIAVGLEAPAAGTAQLYVAGSSGRDVVTATYSAGPPTTVTFATGAGSAPFDEGSAAGEGCSPPAAGSVTCTLSAPLDSIVLAGLGGEDDLRVLEFPSRASVMLLGGEGRDTLLGGGTEDVLVDGPGPFADRLEAMGRDDALMHNGGADARLGGEGNDLFLSNSICDGDLLDGGEGRDNSSWTKLDEPVEANLTLGLAGRPTGGEAPGCGAESPDHLQGIEDLEGTSPPGPGDVFYGDAGPNQLLGWSGPDSYFAGAGDDLILANSGDADLAIDCGEGNDTAFVDESQDPTPVGCETVNGALVNEFRETLLPPPPPPTKVVDTTAPATRIRHRPRASILTRGRLRKVAFSFSSNESGSRFRCRLDRRGFSGCRSPRAYRVAAGRHSFAVFAIDRAGNRDPTPARFAFRVRRR